MAIFGKEMQEKESKRQNPGGCPKEKEWERKKAKSPKALFQAFCGDSRRVARPRATVSAAGWWHLILHTGVFQDVGPLATRPTVTVF